MRWTFFVATATILALLGVVWSQPRNTTSWADTTAIAGFFADSTRYTEWRALSKFEEALLSLSVDDPDEDGFADDSVYFGWSYQLGLVAVDSSGDTAIAPVIEVFVDSVNSAHFGVRTVGTSDSSGVPGIPLLGVDTLALDGYAVITRPVAPFYAPFWRQKFVGVAGNNVSGALYLRYQESRRVFQPVSPR